VKAFQPYDQTLEVNEEARRAGASLILEGERYEPRRKTFIYVNNRLEGNALATISSHADRVSLTIAKSGFSPSPLRRPFQALDAGHRPRRGCLR
jgi:hypothetical protein